MAVDPEGCKVPYYYYKSRLMTEYLIDVKGYSYDAILKDTTSGEVIFSELVTWNDKHGVGD